MQGWFKGGPASWQCQVGGPGCRVSLTQARVPRCTGNAGNNCMGIRIAVMCGVEASTLHIVSWVEHICSQAGNFPITAWESAPIREGTWKNLETSSGR